jgi:hypothetical protein
MRQYNIYATAMNFLGYSKFHKQFSLTAISLTSLANVELDYLNNEKYICISTSSTPTLIPY